MWGRWADAMEGIREFYQLDEPIRQGMVEDAVEYVEAYVEALTYVDVPYRTDGEVPERTWAEASPIAGSTRQMGAGGRRDFLHDLEDRPLTKVQLEFLAWRSSDSFRARTQPKVKLFPLDKKKVVELEVKLEKLAWYGLPQFFPLPP
ncbi:hypothetical protein C8R47DRAFT_1082898 [Mycena vitilis]|nr:hypothetical protein C8R47DRAFT_1082898 [Mycena vitilis]